MPGPDVLRLRRLVFSAILCTIVDLNESPSKTMRVRHFYRYYSALVFSYADSVIIFLTYL